jgi:hypothetical protein
MTLRERIIADLKAEGVEREVWVFGCDTCEGANEETCEYYMDMYNLDGDCLAEK